MKLPGRNVFILAAMLCIACAGPQVSAAPAWLICVSNEKSGDVTLINGADNQPLATIPVGKRPRGILSSRDGRTLFVALSGTPISPPPQLDANGNPILHKGHDD